MADEEHFGETVYATRKRAIQARRDDRGIEHTLKQVISIKG